MVLKAWSEDEIEAARHFYGRVDPELLSKAMGRSPAAIRAMTLRGASARVRHTVPLTRGADGVYAPATPLPAPDRDR